MREQDKLLLDGIREMEEQAPTVGLCSYPFRLIRQSVEALIAERDELAGKKEAKQSAVG